LRRKLAKKFHSLSCSPASAGNSTDFNQNSPAEEILDRADAPDHVEQRLLGHRQRQEIIQVHALIEPQEQCSETSAGWQRWTSR